VRVEAHTSTQSIMNSGKYWLRLAAGLIAVFGTLPAAVAESKTPAVAQAHLDRLDRFRTDHPQSLVNATPGRTLEQCAESVRLMPAYQWTVLGKANASAYYRAFLDRFQVREFRRELGETADFGGQVGEYGRFTQQLTRKSSGREYALVGKYLDLWEKTADGGLRLITQVWSYDEPLEFGDELRFAEVPAVQMAFQAHVPVKGGISFELAALNKLHEVAISQHDGAVWSQFFADDAVLIPTYTPARRGRQAIDDYVNAHVQHLPVFEKLDIRNDRIDDLGDYVIEYATHVANWRHGDASGVNTGKNIRIWRREPSGALRFFWQMGNYD
jgi:ketosteroid isomerase-like protein